jgi:membrane protein required for colicin V production
MNIVDIVILILLAWGAFRGYTQGFILQLVTFIALFIGIWASIRFSGSLSGVLSQSFGITGKYLPVLSFILIFFLVVVIAHLIGMLLTKIFEFAALGWLNRLGGVAFGLIKMIFIISVLLAVQYRMREKIKIIPEKQREGSLLYKPISSIAPAIFPNLKLLAFDKQGKEAESTEEKDNVD